MRPFTDMWLLSSSFAGGEIISRDIRKLVIRPSPPRQRQIRVTSENLEMNLSHMSLRLLHSAEEYSSLVSKTALIELVTSSTGQ